MYDFWRSRISLRFIHHRFKIPAFINASEKLTNPLKFQTKTSDIPSEKPFFKGFSNHDRLRSPSGWLWGACQVALSEADGSLTVWNTENTSREKGWCCLFRRQFYFPTCLSTDSVSMETAKILVKNSLACQAHYIFRPMCAKNKHCTEWSRKLNENKEDIFRAVWGKSEMFKGFC